VGFFFGFFPPAGALVRGCDAPGAEIPPRQQFGSVHIGVWEFVNSVMIPPLVHQRRPCYDFYFL
jgi:hypothetical protein